jgi:NTP pyrophosphatase (non-canonical NTP hydrolase)
MSSLPKSPTLPEVQKFITQLEQEKGWDKDTVLQKCLMLGEEVGELFRSIRKTEASLPYDSKSPVASTAEELADILMLLCFIANRLEIDLESALREKDTMNRMRRWNL